MPRQIRHTGSAGGELAGLFGAGAAGQHRAGCELASRLCDVAGLADFGRVAGQALEHQVGVIEFAGNCVEP